MTSNLRGIVLMVVAMAFFAVEDMSVKLSSREMGTGQILFVMGLIGTGFFALLAKRQGVGSLWSPQFFARTVLMRNIGEIFGTTAFVTAVTTAQLSTATAVFQALPLAITLGAAVFLGERVGWRRWTAICVGFLGMLIIIRPGMDGFDPNALWSVVAVVFLGMRDLSTRRAPDAVNTLQLGGWGMASVTVLGFFMMLFVDGPVVPSTFAASTLLLASIVGFLGYWALTEATRWGEVSALTPFRYTRLLFALVIGFFVFKEIPDQWTLLGSALIVGSGLYALARERKLRRLSMRDAAR